MGAGKSTIGREVARLAQRPFVDTDEEIERRHGPVARIFEERGEAEFRRLEEETAADALAGTDPVVISLGGGALTSQATRERLKRAAFAVWIDVDPDLAWQRCRSSERPLARDEAAFRALFEERLALYDAAADEVAQDVHGVLLGCLRVAIETNVGRDDLLEAGTPAWVADENVARLHGDRVGARRYLVPGGEEAKSLAVAERLWNELDLDRDGTIVAIGGGATTDLAGFVAATYLRGVRWVAVPTTLVGQVDAAIGGKTAINLDRGKNLVGAFHFPERVLIDPAVLATLPGRERRNGLAEAVKTGLLAGREVWNLPEEEMIRACAAFKSAVVLSDPYEHTGRRSILNLGHTFAHALEAGSGYAVAHGEAVALGLLAALRLSGLPTDPVEEVLRPQPARVDPERAWEAMRHDKKARDGRLRLVLLESPGRPVFPAEVAEHDVRRALEALTRK